MRNANDGNGIVGSRRGRDKSLLYRPRQAPSASTVPRGAAFPRIDELTSSLLLPRLQGDGMRMSQQFSSRRRGRNDGPRLWADTRRSLPDEESPSLTNCAKATRKGKLSDDSGA